MKKNKIIALDFTKEKPSDDEAVSNKVFFLQMIFNIL